MKKYEGSFSSRVGVSIMVNTREMAAEYRLSQWAQVLQERAQSGLSIKAYCKQVGICGNTYFYWQRRVRAAAAELVSQEANDPAVCFSEVRTLEKVAYPAAAQASVPGQLQIDVGGVRLTADNTYPVEQLTQLLQALNRPC